jgi:hypothetical protein
MNQPYVRKICENYFVCAENESTICTQKLKHTRLKVNQPDVLQKQNE